MKHRNTPGKPSRPSSAKRRPVGSILPRLNAKSITDFLKTQDGQSTKADIIAHFALTGEQHVALRHLLQDMVHEGLLQKGNVQIVKLADDTDGSSPSGFVGIFTTQRHGGGIIKSTQRNDKSVVTVTADGTGGAHDGDLVEVKGNKVIRVIAQHKDANFVSLLAIRNFDVPDAFPSDVIAETQGMVVPQLDKRTDLRNLQLVTIDGEDARDFDDAVHAVTDSAADNKGGWVITVAIADVSYYVRPDSALDKEAFKRGNSLYFPDRVVPMLPEALSNDLCSLRPHEDRACMAIRMRINKQGELIDQTVMRGLMKSVARLTYTQVQEALDGKADDTTRPILADVIMPLYGAYKTLLMAREARGTIDLDVPERKIELKNGVVANIHMRERYDSHKLIEEMMILANVAAATLLEDKHQPLLYRAHAKPDPVRMESTRNFLKEFGYRLKTGVALTPKDFRQVLQQSEGHDEAPLVNEILLRTMSQAEYSPFNVGHFGLALERYAHFTSPIRRYADLIVHRALIKAYHLGDDGLTDAEQNKLPHIAQHISDRERVAQAAERETIDRYVALYLQDKVGSVFTGRVSGVTKAGLFVTLEETGADGLLPMRLLPQDFYEHDEQRHMLIGRRNGITFRLTMPIKVELMEADSISGRLVLQPAPGAYAESPPRYRKRSIDEADLRTERPGGRGRPPRDGGREPRTDDRPPRTGRDDRPTRSDERPARGGFSDRPSFDKKPGGKSFGSSADKPFDKSFGRSTGRPGSRRRDDDSRSSFQSDERFFEDRPPSPRGRKPSFDDRPPSRGRSDKPSFGDRKPSGKPSFGDRPSFGERSGPGGKPGGRGGKPGGGFGGKPGSRGPKPPARGGKPGGGKRGR